MRHFIFLILAIVFLFPALGLAQTADQVFEAPETLQEAREGTTAIIDKILGAIPRAIARIWNNEIIPAWRAMGEWAKEELWKKRVVPAGQAMADQIKKLLGQEIEERKPLIDQELEKEKEELKQDLWQRFRALFGEDR